MKKNCNVLYYFTKWQLNQTLFQPNFDEMVDIVNHTRDAFLARNLIYVCSYVFVGCLFLFTNAVVYEQFVTEFS